MDDARLVAAIQQGDTSAFETLVRAFSQRLIGFAFTFLRSEDTAHDVVSDVLTKIWIGRNSWQPNGTVRQYLFAAVRNQCYNNLKHERIRHDSEPYAVAHMSEVASRPTSDVQLEAIERDSMLFAALATLNTHQRAVLRLRYLEGMTFKEVAHILGISVSAAEQTSSRALRTLKTRLSG